MSRVLVIAEAGVNHNGSVELAEKLIKEAKKAGADYVKFQTFNSEKLVTASGVKADYQKKTTDGNESQLEMLKKLELNKYEFIRLKKCCEEEGIGFLSTAFDMESVDFLAELGMDCWKIPSGEITNLPLLERIAKENKKVISADNIAALKNLMGE